MIVYQPWEKSAYIIYNIWRFMIPWRMLAEIFQSSQNCIWVLNFFLILAPFYLSVKMIAIHSQAFENHRNSRGKNCHHQEFKHTNITFLTSVEFPATISTFVGCIIKQRAGINYYLCSFWYYKMILQHAHYWYNYLSVGILNISPVKLCYLF